MYTVTAKPLACKISQQVHTLSPIYILLSAKYQWL